MMTGANPERQSDKNADSSQDWLEDELCDDEDEDDDDDGDGSGDGGWGWVVMIASLVCNTIVDGVCYTFGILKEHYMVEFQVSHEQVAWVSSLQTCCYMIVGPIVSKLSERYGTRKVAIVGSFIAATGFILSTQASSIAMLIITSGIIAGTGFGMIYLPAIVTLGQWFNKNLAFATGVAVCGTGCGMFIFAPITMNLIEAYNWRGAHLILAGIMLNCAACAMTFIPRHEVRRMRGVRSVKIKKGTIMKALIAEKERQRAISNGSLDNCIITRDNRLIRVDPALFDASRRSGSFLARFKRSLGLSSPSLGKSKSSVCCSHVPQIVLDAVNEARRGLVTGGRYTRTACRPLTGRIAVAHGDTAAGGRGRGGGDVAACFLSLDQLTPPDNGVGSCSAWFSCHSVNNPVLASSHRRAAFAAGSIVSVQVLSADDHDEEGGALVDASENGGWRCKPRRLGAASAVVVSNSSFLSTSMLNVVSEPHSVQGVDRRVVEGSPGVAVMTMRVVKKMLEMSMLRNPVFALLVLASFLTLFAFFIPFFQIIKKAEEVGADQDRQVFLLSLIGVFNMMGRVVSGWLADRPWVNVIHMNNGALIIAGVATLMVSMADDYNLLIFYSIVFGACVAAFVSLRSVLLVELLGLDMLTNSFGILILFQGLASLLGSPVAGLMQDSQSTVNNGFMMSGCLMLVSGLLGIPIWLLKWRQDSLRQKLCPLTVVMPPGESTV